MEPYRLTRKGKPAAYHSLFASLFGLQRGKREQHQKEKGEQEMTRREQLLRHYEEQKDTTQSRVQDGIERYRKGTVCLRFADKDGQPLSSIRFKAVLERHAFLIGCNLFGLEQLDDETKNRIYRDKYREIFNTGVVPIYWVDLEPKEGTPRYAKDSPFIYRRPPIDLCLEFCEENGIRPKAHCLNYFHRSLYPDWCPEDVPSAQKKCEIRFRSLADRYRQRIPDWDVINETLGSYIMPNLPPIFHMPNSIEWSFELARKYFPENRLFLNDDPPTVWGDLRDDRRTYYLQIDRALSRGSQIDVIGLQSHMIYEKGDPRLQDIMCNPSLTFGTMDLYAQFNKPMQISEVSFPAYSNEAEDEEIQAEWIRNQYSIWFCHPAVEAIIYWDLVDGNAPGAALGAMNQGWNTFYSGLLRYDMSEKPAYKVLKNLFTKEWHTEEYLCSDEHGCAELHGFFGTYRLEIETENERKTEYVTFTKDNKGVIPVILGDS